MPSRKKKRNANRHHTYRRPRDRAGLKFTGAHHCPECGKWCYRTRDDAEAAVRKTHPGATVHYYRCKSNGEEWWHYTSMSAEQVGEIRERNLAAEETPD